MATHRSSGTGRLPVFHWEISAAGTPMATASCAALPDSWSRYFASFMPTLLARRYSLVNSAAQPHEKSRPLCNTRMRTVEEVRRLRLIALRDQHGSLSPIKQRLGMTATDSTLSQIVNQSAGSRTGAPKTMGSPLARRIESAMDLPLGWMDTDPDLGGAGVLSEELADSWKAADPVLRRMAENAARNVLGLDPLPRLTSEPESERQKRAANGA